MRQEPELQCQAWLQHGHAQQHRSAGANWPHLKSCFLRRRQALLTPRMPAEGPEGDAALAGCVAGLRLLAAAANAGPDVLAFPLRGTTLEDAVKAWVLVDDHKPPAVECVLLLA